MPANTTGKPNTSDYVLGRGAVYISTLVNGLPVAWQDLGNSPDFSLSVASDSVDHEGTRIGLKQVDKSTIIRQSVSVKFSLDEFSDQNLAIFLSGNNVESQTNAAVAGFTEYTMVASIVKGRWYDLKNSTGVRAMGITKANLTLEKSGSPDVLLVEGTDYEVDETAGRVFILSSAVNITTGDALDVTLAAAAGAKAIDRVRALTQTNVTVALKFVSINAADNDRITEFQFHQISLKPSGDASLIGDEFAKMEFEGKAEKNTTADANSPTLTVSSLRRS